MSHLARNVGSSSWKLLHSNYLADVLTWGPGKEQFARQGALLSIVGLNEGSAYLCIVGAGDDILLVDLFRLDKSSTYGSPAKHMATFRSIDAGLWLIFRDPSSVDVLRVATKSVTCSVTQTAPSLSDLQALGILVEEDITLFYEHSFLGSPPVQVWDSLFESIIQDAPVKGAVTPADFQTLVDLRSSSTPPDTVSDWTSDEEWSVASFSDDDADDDVYCDASESIGPELEA
ncbi:hypothetical protein OH76DRAFT_1487973 [Lentinus brumalis]|uniref:Uncharacterized protein n=1 Tax=Lentinus brumalis TaxID=2498619 RepID=A0A371CSM3_9APHY|nr:hypothetical protein OH76DRAFT_1487973 [Polyporus brumalis]